MSRWLSVALVTVAVSVSACGGDDASLSDQGAAALHDQVVAVRAAVDARDAPAASVALDTLQAAVADLRRSGDVSATRAAAILRAAGSVRAELVAITTTTTTTTTTQPPPSPPVTADDGGRGRGNHDDGSGKGKGKKGED